jgi:hypothetical protein
MKEAPGLSLRSLDFYKLRVVSMDVEVGIAIASRNEADGRR